MNRQEAITLLRNLEDALDSYCELTEEGKKAFRMAITALNCSEIPNNWIPCSERLPEEGEVVVALEKGKTWDCMTFEGTAEWTEDERMWKKNEATIRIDYWMPKDSALPEP